MTPRPARRSGYIFLISVLVIGAIASTTAVTLVLLGLAAEASGLAVAQSAQAYENAQTCVERALRSLRADLSYAGAESFSLAAGSCELHLIEGGGNEDRSICAEGRNAGATRRMEVRVRRIFPSVRITSWKEVSAFSSCP